MSIFGRKSQFNDLKTKREITTLDSNLLLLAICLSVLVHGAILPFTHQNTYDAFIHMFFAESYASSWFDHWEPRWYLGFSTISYPPGSHMFIAAISNLISLRSAYVVVQVIGLVLLVLGVFRFSLLWVTPIAAGYAAIIVVCSTAIAETIHIFGQLPTILSLGLFLNGVPFIYRWIHSGGKRNFWIAVLFAGGTTAVHHVTTLFGGVFFILPTAIHALNSVFLGDPDGGNFRYKIATQAIGRGVILAIAMIIMIVFTVYPYWYWSITDPITQVPIPHGSRENFIERIDLGIIFFLIPWGPLLFLLPLILIRSLFSNIWPLGIFILISFFLGLGGTTPVARFFLRGAFDILTLDRFTFWSVILAAPIAGHIVYSLVNDRLGTLLRVAYGTLLYRLLVGAFFLIFVASSIAVTVLPKFKPTQPNFIDPAPIINFLKEDNHSRWRYLTLGFGDQFAYISSQTGALSVDGNYHSARRLPAFTKFSVERLENSKYMGVAGIGSLSQFLINANSYNLKYVFSNDEFYDPILYFTGWNRVLRLTNGVVVWEKPNVAPIIFPVARNEMSFEQSMAWATIPPFMLLCTLIFIAILSLKRTANLTISGNRLLIDRRALIISTKVKIYLLRLITLIFLIFIIFSYYLYQPRSLSPEATIERYFESIDRREYADAYELIDQSSQISYADFIYRNKHIGGLYASYGKISNITPSLMSSSENVRNYKVELSWLTSVKADEEIKFITLIKSGQEWKLLPFELDKSNLPTNMMMSTQSNWHVPQKRHAEYQKDILVVQSAPQVEYLNASLVEYKSRIFALGRMYNHDILPAHVSTEASIYAEDGKRISTYNAGLASLHSINPKQVAPFRVDFEGTLSLKDYEKTNVYDPTLYIPTIFKDNPVNVSLNTRTTLSNGGSSSELSIQNARFHETDEYLILDGTLVNSGTKTYSLVKIIVDLSDEFGTLWVDHDYVSQNLTPGQKQEFRIKIPPARQIKRITSTKPKDQRVNGKTSLSSLPIQYNLNSINLGGYESFSITLDGIVFEGDF